MGTVITCVVVALTSTFSPADGGPDSPAVAVMSVLAGSIAAGLAATGASDSEIIINVLVALSVSTFLTGLFLFGIGALKLGQWLRFVPYPVIGGFLAGSGLLLLTGGMEAQYNSLGGIVNLITSAAVRWDSSNYGAYAVAKQGVRALTRAAAGEWGVDKIRVNNIAPLAASPALANWIKHDPEAKTFFQTVALKRVGDCEADIGRAVVALVSPEMDYLTGATLPLDGGQAARH